jgi:hypothetical protein
VGQPLCRDALAAGGPDQLGDLGFHQLLHDPAQRLAQEIEPFAFEQVANDLLARHPLRLGHRGDSSRRRLGGLDESERRGGRTFTRLRPTRSYTTLRDVTAAVGALPCDAAAMHAAEGLTPPVGARRKESSSPANPAVESRPASQRLSV